MVDFPLRSVDKEVHQLKLITIITERGGVGGCSRNLCNPHSNLSGMFTGILQCQTMLFTTSTAMAAKAMGKSSSSGGRVCMKSQNLSLSSHSIYRRGPFLKTIHYIATE